MIGKLRLVPLGVLPLTLLPALLLSASNPALAQSETVLYNFTGGSDGASPSSGLTSDSAGNFYGTTHSGGASGHGTVYELSPNGSGGWNESVLYGFKGGADGGSPLSNVIFDSLENIYGTTPSGGANGLGVVFKLSLSGGSWTESVLYSFTGGTDGANPVSGLIFDKAGNLYGTTQNGGVYGRGTVYELSSSHEGWTEQVIYSSQSADFQNGGVTMDAAGNIFGTTSSTVFELSPAGGWTPTVIHNFSGYPKDGSQAGITPVLDKAGNVYGATFSGGTNNCGTVFRLSPVGKKGKWKENILHSFKCGLGWDNDDGDGPAAGLVFDDAGNIYGTTEAGGASGVGTVFELKAGVGKGSYKEEVVWSFDGTDGSQPYNSSLVRDSAHDLYGTASGGGLYGFGVVFEVTPQDVP